MSKEMVLMKLFIYNYSFFNDENIEMLIFSFQKVKVSLISVLSIVALLQGTKLHTPKSNVKARANH